MPQFLLTIQRKNKSSKARSTNVEKPKKKNKKSLVSEDIVEIQSGEGNSMSINKAAKERLEPKVSRKSLQSLDNTAKRRNKRDTEGRFIVFIRC